MPCVGFLAQGMCRLGDNATEGVALNGQSSVLVVDQLDETREVLQTVLERRGVRTLTADRTSEGIALAQQHQPDLIVLDMETCEAGVPSGFGKAVDQYEPQVIVLGSLRNWRKQSGTGEFVSKPYHYGPLVRKIEELLATRRSTVSGQE